MTGDKSNHVASLHVPQMLYIWPYTLFFSLPTVTTSVLSAYTRNTLSYPNIDTAIGILAAVVFWIAMNTIVHPFTLADNRHYIFYVFRILMRRPLYKFFAAPVYMLCGWASLVSFGGKTSSVLIWLLVTTLSVVTAPLVEPRYFILPWIMWRLHVGEGIASGKRTSGTSSTPAPLITRAAAILEQYGLWLETLWFLLINFATGYIFLRWKFEWSQEPGEAMRFMW
jgi:alpha-1,2-glucosyltransferase